MTKKSLVNNAQEIVLEHGFVHLAKPEKKWLDVARLNIALQERKIRLCVTWGSMKYDKLLQFCKKCIDEGNEDMIITVIAKGGDSGMTSYQCLFECNGSRETFALNRSFFEDFGKTEKTRKSTPVYTSAYV